MLDKDSLKPVLESLIFAADSAISFDKLAGILEGEEKPAIKEALHELISDYRAKAGGFLLEEVAGGFQFRTNPEFAPWLRKFFKIGMQKISKAAMESLAVIAYKQPVTRGEIEAVRGVDSGGVLATLMEKRFIKIVGRKEVPGRPVVYGTTKEFLETFDLKDLSCLPTLKDIQKVEEEYAQTEGQGTAETAVEDRVQGAEKASGGIETEVQEPVQDGKDTSPEGEDIQDPTEAGDGDGESWEETDSEEMGSGGRKEELKAGNETGPGEEGPEDGASYGRASGQTPENGSSDAEPGEEGPEDGATDRGAAGETDEDGASYGRAPRQTPENGSSDAEPGEEGPEDRTPGGGETGETAKNGDSESPDLEERDREGDPDSET
ncbi:MAG: SMC-Scp complex subunit ScpB [Deltaproteobacteria bacterium]|nr:SMC-Scp complex subunit ScpB [Deltaproteobacteria bacterium]